MNNIILIGMPGSGKTTLGKKLAQELEYEFLDIDEIIKEKTKKELHQILQERNSIGFMRLEEYFMKKIQTKRTVIAPGGSCIYSDKGMKNFEKLGTIIYLKVTYNEIVKRLGDYSNRGIIGNKGHTLEEIYKERNSLYIEYAQHILSGDNIQVKDLVSILGIKTGRSHDD